MRRIAPSPPAVALGSVAPLVLVAAFAGCGGGSGAAPPVGARPAGGGADAVGSTAAASTGSTAASPTGSTAKAAAGSSAATAPAPAVGMPANAAADAAPADPVAAALASGLYPTAQILRRTLLRAAPRGRALARIGPRTEFGSPSVLSVIRRRGAWLAVHAAQLPNGRAGWLPATAVRLGSVDLAIHVDRSARRLTVRRGDRVLRRFTIAVGRPGNVTPTGRFAVTDKLLMPAGGPYGCCAVALTGHQLHLPSGWAGGDRLAIHGTNAPWSIGQAASLGCMRAAGADVRWLLRRMPLGAPVFIRA